MKQKKTISMGQLQGISSLNQRKLNHVSACLDDSVDRQQDSFAGYKLRYQALPEISLAEVSTETTFAEKTISAPLIISSMTGGIGGDFERINNNLARAAEALNIPLGLGSMKVMLSHQEAEASFQIRNVAPKAIIISNLGLASFNYGLEYTDVERIIDRVQPDLFGLHLNALQEAIQDGGETNFRGLLNHLREIVSICPLPVYIKECGGGISEDLVGVLADTGVDYIDISGNDGTSWAAVEGKIGGDLEMSELFKDFGLPTALILENMDTEKKCPARIIASGGIRNGIQVVKALALGAQYVSVARPFLRAALESPESVIEVGKRLIEEIRIAMFLTGCNTLTEINRALFYQHRTED